MILLAGKNHRNITLFSYLWKEIFHNHAHGFGSILFEWFFNFKPRCDLVYNHPQIVKEPKVFSKIRSPSNALLNFLKFIAADNSTNATTLRNLKQNCKEHMVEILRWNKLHWKDLSISVFWAFFPALLGYDRYFG